MPLFRTVGDFVGAMTADSLRPLSYDEVQRLPVLQNLSAINCHNGQKKLAMTVIEFLAVALKDLSLEASDDVVVVYAGASGLATVVAATVFPRVTFVIYDKDPSVVQLISKKFEDIKVHTVKHPTPDTSSHVVVYREWFDDAEARKFSAMKGKKVLFISDVRGDDNYEIAISRDMRDQQRWAVLSGSLAYMFKFRVPYLSPDRASDTATIMGAYSDTSHMSAAAEGTGATFESCNKRRSRSRTSCRRKSCRRSRTADTIEYLSGCAYIQTYGRPLTAELRLIGFAKEVDGKRVYSSANYSIRAIEDAMATFNAFYRSHAAFKFDLSHDFFKDRFPSYEAVAEFEIVMRCRAALGESFSIDGIKSTLDSVALAVDEFITDKATPEQCSVRTSKTTRTRTDIAKKYIDKCAEGMRNTAVVGTRTRRRQPGGHPRWPRRP